MRTTTSNYSRISLSTIVFCIVLGRYAMKLLHWDNTTNNKIIAGNHHVDQPKLDYYKFYTSLGCQPTKTVLT